MWLNFTDGSKIEQGVGSAVTILTGRELTEQLKFKLHNRCSNNKAEQLATVTALEFIVSQPVIMTNTGQQSSTKTEGTCRLNKERQESQPPCGRYQKESSKTYQKERENRTLF